MCQSQAALLKDLKMDLVAESIEQNWDFDSKLDFVCVNHDAWQDR